MTIDRTALGRLAPLLQGSKVLVGGHRHHFEPVGVEWSVLAKHLRSVGSGSQVRLPCLLMGLMIDGACRPNDREQRGSTGRKGVAGQRGSTGQKGGHRAARAAEMAEQWTGHEATWQSHIGATRLHL